MLFFMKELKYRNSKTEIRMLRIHVFLHLLRARVAQKEDFVLR